MCCLWHEQIAVIWWASLGCECVYLFSCVRVFQQFRWPRGRLKDEPIVAAVRSVLVLVHVHIHILVVFVVFVLLVFVLVFGRRECGGSWHYYYQYYYCYFCRSYYSPKNNCKWCPCAGLAAKNESDLYGQMKYARLSEPTGPESSQLKFNYATKDEGEAA